ncbi:transcriptional regulator [Paludisphaera sp.]|uniref:helix-turn-helix transcriptional regulator n=1 Tax=Paludisphaera sp. TaxID=2017432 RepID=UPI00301CFE4D
MLELIQGRGRHDLADLASELECSTRTVRRYLDVLELAGVPFYRDREAGCYRVRPDFRFPSLNFTGGELLGQATAAAITSAPGLDVTLGAGPTTRKLAATSGDEAAATLEAAGRLTTVLDLKLADHSRCREAVRTAQWALLEGRQLAGRYLSPHDPRTKKLTLHPYRLCLLKQAWYLIARPSDGDGPRTYRVARFKTLRMLDVVAVVPPDFDLKAYFGDAWCVLRGERSYDVEILFDRDAADLATETTWHHTQRARRRADGSLSLEFRVDGLEEIAGWVVGWSGWAEAVRPAELRAMVVERLRTALRRYGEATLPGD